MKWVEVEDDGECLIFESKEDGAVAVAYENGCVDLAGNGKEDSVHACDLRDLISALRELRTVIKAAYSKRGKKWPM